MGKTIDITTGAGWIFDTAVLPHARIHQGDLIRFNDTDNDLERLAVVVTADCDLAHNKHARLLTLVPVVSARTILEHYLIPDDCEKRRLDIERYALNLSSASTDATAVRYASLEQFELPPGHPGREPFCIARDFLLHRLHAISYSSYQSLFNAMQSKGKTADAFNQQLRSRGDLLILPESEQIPIRGHVAWIRRLRQIHYTDVALRTSDLSTKTAERIGRLDSPYRYRLTQLIGQVFADIGLPDGTDSIDAALTEACT